MAEWRTGWRFVAAGALGMGTGVAMLMIVGGIFVQPMQAELGWSRTALTINTPVGLLMAFAMPLGAIVADRWGARRAGIVGLATLAMSFALLATVPMSHVAFLALLLLVGGIAGPLTSAVVFTRDLARHFEYSRGTAFGVSMSSNTLVSVLVTPTLAFIVAKFGWRAGFWALAMLIGVFGIPAVAFFLRGGSSSGVRNASASADRAVRLSLRFVFRTGRFWLLLLAVIAAAIPIGGMLASLQPLLLSKGFDVKSAAALGSVFATSIVLGRLIGGFLLDRFWAPGVAALFMVLPALGAFAMLGSSAHQSHWWTNAGAVWLLGFAEGAEVDYIGFFCARLFDLELYSKVLSLMVAAVYVAIALSGFAFAAVFDRLNSYDPAIRAAIVFYLVSSLGFLSLGLFVRIGGSAAPAES